MMSRQELDTFKAEVETKLEALKARGEKNLSRVEKDAVAKYEAIKSNADSLISEAKNLAEDKLEVLDLRLGQAKAHYQEVEDLLESKYKGLLGFIRRILAMFKR